VGTAAAASGAPPAQSLLAPFALSCLAPSRVTAAGRSRRLEYVTPSFFLFRNPVSREKVLLIWLVTDLFCFNACRCGVLPLQSAAPCCSAGGSCCRWAGGRSIFALLSAWTPSLLLTSFPLSAANLPFSTKRLGMMTPTAVCFVALIPLPLVSCLPRRKKSNCTDMGNDDRWHCGRIKTSVVNKIQWYSILLTFKFKFRHRLLPILKCGTTLKANFPQGKRSHFCQKVEALDLYDIYI